MKLGINKIIVLAAALLVLILVLPLGLEQFFGSYAYLSAVRYILAGVIAIPTAIYAVKKYRKTARRFYILPCFMVALGFWTASMFFMQQNVPDSLHQNTFQAMAKRGSNLYEKPIDNARHFYLIRNYHNNAGPLFFNEPFKPRIDSTSLNKL